MFSALGLEKQVGEGGGLKPETEVRGVEKKEEHRNTVKREKRTSSVWAKVYACGGTAPIRAQPIWFTNERDTHEDKEQETTEQSKTTKPARRGRREKVWITGG